MPSCPKSPARGGRSKPYDRHSPGPQSQPVASTSTAAQVPSTPLTYRYTPQDAFPIVNDDHQSIDYLESLEGIDALKECVEIARRVFFSAKHLSILTVAYRQSGAAKGVKPKGKLPKKLTLASQSLDQTLMDKIRRLEETAPLKIILDASMPPDEQAYVDPERDTIIHLNYKFVPSLIEAHRRQDKNPINDVYAKIHIAFVLVHELSHWGRLQIYPSSDTPPQVRPSETNQLMRDGIDDKGRKVLFGEGGWYTEQCLFGGQIGVIEYGKAESDYHYRGKIKSMTVKSMVPPYAKFTIDAHILWRVFQGEDGWEECFPFALAAEHSEETPQKIGARKRAVSYTDGFKGFLHAVHSSPFSHPVRSSPSPATDTTNVPTSSNMDALPAIVESTLPIRGDSHRCGYPRVKLEYQKKKLLERGVKYEGL